MKIISHVFVWIKFVLVYVKIKIELLKPKRNTPNPCTVFVLYKSNLCTPYVSIWIKLIYNAVKKISKQCVMNVGYLSWKI